MSGRSKQSRQTMVVFNLAAVVVFGSILVLMFLPPETQQVVMANAKWIAGGLGVLIVVLFVMVMRSMLSMNSDN